MHHRFALAVVVAALVACAPKESPPNDSTAAAAAPAPNVVTFTAKDFAFDGPDTIPAGVTTMRLVNQGPNYHHAQLLRFDEGKTFADFQAALKTMKPTDHPPSWVVPVGGPNPPEIGAESAVTETLEPGNYAVVCYVDIPDHVPHVMKGMAKAFVVVPATSLATEPAADVTLQLVDYAFNASTPLTAGKHTIRVENVAQQPHEVFIAKLDSGKTVQDLLKWGESYKGRPPFKALGGVAFIVPGRHAILDVDLAPGEYALVCFVPDAKDGKPHFMHGMATQIKVS